jgi:hypothetical protein
MSEVLQAGKRQMSESSGTCPIHDCMITSGAGGAGDVVALCWDNEEINAATIQKS